MGVLAADPAMGLIRSLALLFGGLVLLPIVFGLVVRIFRGPPAPPPDIAADPRSILTAPGPYVEACERSHYRDEIVSARSAAIIVLFFGVPAYLAYRIFHDTPGAVGTFAPLVAGGVAVFLWGQNIVRSLASKRAVRRADADLRDALAAGWRAEAPLVDAWAAHAGMTRAPAAPLPATWGGPLLRAGTEADVANVLSGTLDGREAAVFHMTQMLPDSTENGPGRRFRLLTCARVALPVDTPSLTLEPRGKEPPCPLDQVAGRRLGDAWRAAPAPGGADADGFADGDAADLEQGLERLVAAGLAPPSLAATLGALQRAPADPAARGRMEAEIAAQMMAWAQARRASGDAPGLRDALRVFQMGRPREIETESAELADRYRVTTTSQDQQAVIRTLSPATIVAILDGGGPVRMELQGRALLVAFDGRLVEPAALDALLARTRGLATRLIAARGG